MNRPTFFILRQILNKVLLFDRFVIVWMNVLNGQKTCTGKYLTTDRGYDFF